MIVVDASVLANVVGDDGADGRVARRAVRSAGDIAAADLVAVETVGVLRKRWMSQMLSTARLASAMDDLEDLPVTRFPTQRLMRRAHELQDNVTPYDAAYSALAESLAASCSPQTRALES